MVVRDTQGHRSGAGNASRGFRKFHADFMEYMNSVDNYGLRTTVVSGATVGIQGIANGVMRFTAAGDGADAAMAATRPVWQPSLGDIVVMEARVRSSNVGKSSIFVGFTDAPTETGAVIAEYEDAALNIIPDDCVGFLLEGEQDLSWQIVSAKDNANSGPTPVGHLTHDAVNNRLQMLRIELNELGNAWFYIDGDRVHYAEGIIDPTHGFGFGMSIDDRSTAYTVDLEEVFGCGPTVR